MRQTSAAGADNDGENDNLIAGFSLVLAAGGLREHQRA
jgi:hypothetical protein